MLPLLLFACSGGVDTGPDDTGDTADTGDTDTADTADTAVTGDTADTADTGDTDSGDTGPHEGLAGRFGAIAATTTTYAGTEDWYFLDEDGEDLCRLRFTVAGVGARDDCAECAFAHDVVYSDLEVLTDIACGAVYGPVADLDPKDFDSIAYGYVPDYYGHAQVLFVDEGAGWGPVGFATWDEASHDFAYDWLDGYHTY